MTSIVFFIEQIAFGLYILCVGGILVMAYRLQQARHDLAVAQFKLEREHALVRQANAVTFGGLLLEMLIGVWAISNLMAPTLRDIRLGDQPNSTTAKRFVTSTPGAGAAISLGGGNFQLDPTDPAFRSPTPVATPVGTIIADAPDVVGCSRDSAWLFIPANGQLLFEATTIEGTANISNFAFYRFEIKSVETGAEFAPIGGDYTSPVTEGPLGEILPFNFATGEYRFRLSVFDNTTMLRAVCEITIHISEPPITPTPTVNIIENPS